MPDLNLRANPENGESGSSLDDGFNESKGSRGFDTKSQPTVTLVIQEDELGNKQALMVVEEDLNGVRSPTRLPDSNA